ncbi:unnamed protein product [Allacma fusca]|uniref:Uncharacterized protein n=1 Tax=Allacma fusca TaxID=39272 RepID=A0A8J2JKJ9_9HEXA|nr:unnamed protein product [Allacma fusca]
MSHIFDVEKLPFNFLNGYSFMLTHSSSTKDVLMKLDTVTKMHLENINGHVFSEIILDIEKYKEKLNTGKSKNRQFGRVLHGCACK